jgi:Spy/CpxP family protein refolding chaperone
MTHWIKRAILGLVSATVLVGGLTACARGQHHGPWTDERAGEVRGKVIEKVSSKLDLNDAQRQKLNLLADALMAQRKALRGDNSAPPRAQMQALIQGSTFERQRAQQLLSQKTEAIQSHGPQVIAALADFYDSLNAAQQQQVRERLAEGKGGWWRH